MQRTFRERLILSSSITGFMGVGIKIVDKVSELIKLYPEKLNDISLFIFNSLGVKHFSWLRPTEQLGAILIILIVSIISVSGIKSEMSSNN